ncbi:MAG: serine hydrolase domain-containing protein [Alphaproteobacteria bacterium]|jgi:CubicO group peptidase (beta-lactamase class C family)
MSSYFPPFGDDAWARTTPQEAGLSAEGVADAIAHAQAHETPWVTNLSEHLNAGHFEPPPWNEIIGPTRGRGGPSGVIIAGGKIAAEWGTPWRPDMTFSVAKSFISLCVGMAHDEGLIPDLDAPIRELVDDGGFDDAQNQPITWRMMLQLTSEWEGELWSKPDLVDRNRELATEGLNKEKGKARPLVPAGTFWEYNDVRVNRLALAALRVWHRGLPSLLKERIMDPIGASLDWEWHGYRNSWVDLDGKHTQSVSGGGHWGGGMFISAFDLARAGLLMARGGQWEGKQLISQNYLQQAATPCALNPSYGLMFWLNTHKIQYPNAPAHAVMMHGAGANRVYVDAERDLVVVLRWIDGQATNGFLKRLYS